MCGVTGKFVLVGAGAKLIYHPITSRLLFSEIILHGNHIMKRCLHCQAGAIVEIWNSLWKSIKRISVLTGRPTCMDQEEAIHPFSIWTEDEMVSI
jgi:hypothetical protein